MLNKVHKIKFVISIFLKKSKLKKIIHSIKIIKKIAKENHKNFHKIKSFLQIGLLKIRKIVFHSISLKSNWLQINKIEISQKNSIIDNQKSIIILLVSQIVNFESKIDKNIKIIQNKTII